MVLSANASPFQDFRKRSNGLSKSECLNRLHRLLYRANNLGNIPGNGLGLAIVKKAVDLHEGTIKVDSEISCYYSYFRLI